MTATTHTPPDVPAELERQLQSMRFKQMGITRQPVELARNRVVDEEALGNAAALEAARAVLAERLRSHREYDELTQQITALEARLANAQQRVRIENAERADRRLATAQQAYYQAQIACGKAFRSFLQANQRSSNTPGASAARVDYSLHLPGITPMSWNGTSGQIMSTTTLPFEED